MEAVLTLREYKKLLENHDWYYGMADDHRVYQAGQDAELKLKELAKLDKAFEKAYKDKRKQLFGE